MPMTAPDRKDAPASCPVETIVSAYLETAHGDAGLALRCAITDALSDLMEGERQARERSRLISRGLRARAPGRCHQDGLTRPVGASTVTISPHDALYAPAVARNRDAILAVLRRVLPSSGLVLEVASGTGEHIVHFASALPGLIWQPSDMAPACLGSIAAHTDHAALPNVLPALALDAASRTWPADRADAVLSINMIHIAPWQATEGLLAGANRVLPEGGVLFLYGPFKEGGTHTAPSNEAFDADLRMRDAAWGVRDVEAVSEIALAGGLRLAERVAMPANNLSLIYRRT